MADSLSIDQQKALALASARKKQSESSPTDEPKLNSIERGAAERVLGTEELINNLGIGKHIGLPSNEILEGAKKISEEQGKGTGISGFLGEMAGDPLTYAGGSLFRGATTVPKIVQAGARAGAAQGLTSGGEDENKNLKNAIEDAAFGSGLSLAIPAVPAAVKSIGKNAKLFGEGFSARTNEQLLDAAGQIRDEADSYYKDMRKLNANISKDSVEKLKNEVGKKLNDTGIFNEELHKGTLSVLRQLDASSKNGISLESLDQHRRLLSAVANQGKPEDRKKAIAAINAMDDVVENLKPSDFSNQSKEAVTALNNARATWSKSRKFEMIADALEKANGDPNRRKVLLDQLANNKKKTRNFSDEEVKALKEAANSNTVEGLMKMAGKFGITFGEGRAAATGNVIPAVELLTQGFRKGIPVIMAATGAKSIQNKIGQGKSERLLKLIESGKISPEEAINAEKSPLPQIEGPR